MTALRSLAALASFITNSLGAFAAIVAGIAALGTALLALMCMSALLTLPALLIGTPMVAASVLMVPVSLIVRGDFTLMFLPWQKAAPVGAWVARTRAGVAFDRVGDAVMDFADASTDVTERFMDRRCCAMGRASRRMLGGAAR